MSRKRSSKLNVLLIRRDLKDHKDILEDIDALEQISLNLLDGGNSVPAVLFYKHRSEMLPRWASYLREFLDPMQVPRLSSAPAVLFVPVDDRIFAVVFSHGKSLLETGTYDQTFGLRAALNSINPVKVRSYDKRRFDALFRQTREQASRNAKLEEFGIDAERDLLRKVSGKPEDETLGTSMTGGSSLSVATKVRPNELTHYLRRLSHRSSDNRFLEEYPWLGRIEEELDDEIGRVLDLELDDQLAQDNGNIHLAVPQIIDWSESSGFRFVLPNRSTTVFSDISLKNLTTALDGTQPITVDLLRGKSVEMLDENDHRLHHWNLYNCVNAELYIGSEQYVLSFGSWYKVDSDLLEQVDREISELPEPTFVLPHYDVSDRGEYEYNQRVANESPEEFLLLDQEWVHFDDNRSRFELCDLLTSSGDLVHVKRYGGSSVLSHLFAQGLVSADLLMKRPGFRESADQLVKSKDFSLPKDREFSKKARRNVVYAVVGGRPDLPLFARINLRNAVRSIRAFNWNVQLAIVDETPLRKKLTRERRRHR